ncbi:MFS transporter [Lihuaxuella thermophila]|uniref:Predicted arabinose efflux permease, MFS family n=1 Tax=Lihuaxuella thermophila TaxID=1173111 RepID=A0A1H8AJ46_9BACL|nr:MFS transporter [Lihuaxuella thermophila]SEM69547.1 Predicted arabinose efflux permease, MFS family [Lihuaxuella thermophila]
MLSVKNRPFWLLLSAETISALGDMIGLFSIEWLLYQMTGSKWLMGSVLVAFSLPEVIIRLIAAPLIDRVDRVRLMSALNALRFFTLLALALFAFTRTIEVWHIFVAAVVLGSCSALFIPAGMALVPNLLGKQHFVRGYSLMDGFTNTARLLGPVIGSTLVSVSDPSAGIGVNAVTYALSAALLFLLPKQTTSHSEREQLSACSWKQLARDWAAGFLFFRQVPALFVIMILLAVSNLCFSSWNMLIIPLGQEVLNIRAVQIGLLMPAFSLGIITGTLITSWLGEVRRRRVLMLGSFIAMGIFIVLMSMSREFILTLCLFFLLGLTIPFFNSYSSALYGQLVPDNYRGRVMSVRLLLGQGMIPLGGFLGGVVSESFGLPLLLLLSGIIQILCGLIGLFMPLLRGIDGDLTPLAEQIQKKLAPHPTGRVHATPR